MRSNTLFVAGMSALSAGLVSAAPQLKARWGDSNSSGLSQSDLEIAAFALNLENLESNFYTMALNMFNESAFTAAGLGPDVRGRYQQVLEHELTHAAVLRGVLGSSAPQPCNYSFPLNTIEDLLAISFALESTGEAAYSGAAPFIESPLVLKTAVSFAAVEGRQSSYFGTLSGHAPWYGPFVTPLNQTQVISLASGFIVNCPSDNFPLAVEPVPTLTVTPSSNITVGTSVNVTIGQPDFDPSNFPIKDKNVPAALAHSGSPNVTFLAYFHGGQNVTFSPISQNGTTTVPAGLAGAVWAQVVDTDQGFPTIDNVLSGVAMLNIPVPADADNSFN